MEPDPSVSELAMAVARIQGMLLSEQNAAKAVDQLAQVARATISTAVGAGASLFDDTGPARSTGATDAFTAAADAPRRLSASVQSALADRQEVGVAVRVLMERHGTDVQQARAALLDESVLQDRPLTEVARQTLARPADQDG